MKTNFKHYFKNQGATIEQEIDSIFQLLVSQLSEKSVVVIERPSKGVSCKGVIIIYNRHELKRQRNEQSAYENALRAGQPKSSLIRPFKAKPVLMYAFYPDTVNPKRLGSVAIYGENVMADHIRFKKGDSLFGRTIISVKVEMGIRPFLDVRLV